MYLCKLREGPLPPCVPEKPGAWELSHDYRVLFFISLVRSFLASCRFFFIRVDGVNHPLFPRFRAKRGSGNNQAVLSHVRVRDMQAFRCVFYLP